jgi:PST family polysaccharide transporter
LWTTGLLGKITFQFDDFLVGNLNRPASTIWLGAGVEPEALYSRAYTVGKMPMDVVAGMIGSIALSLYAESAARGRAVLSAVYRQLTWLLAWIIFFSSTMAFVTASEVVYVLGEQWTPMVPLFRLMFLFVVGRPLFQNNAQLLLAMRAERDYSWTMIAQAAFILIACLPAVYLYGAAGAAGVVSLMSLIGLVMTEWLVARQLNESVWRVYVVPAITGGAVIAGVTLLSPLLPANLWLAAILKGLIGATVFGIALLLFERKMAGQAWATIRKGLALRNAL